MKRTVAFYWLIGIAVAALAIALGFYFDDTVRDFMAEHQTPALRSFMRYVSLFGDWPSHVAFGLLFLAIAWIYREDYAKAGFAMLPVFDPDGQRTSRQAVSHTLGLLPISLCPFLFGLEGTVYLTGALVLSLGFVWQAIRFSRDLTVQRARRLFYASIIYLPLLLGLMVFDKIK